MKVLILRSWMGNVDFSIIQKKKNYKSQGSWEALWTRSSAWIEH